jgi:hypothetical protein
MPLGKIHVVEGRYDEARIAKVSGAIQAALMNTLGVPPERSRIDALGAAADRPQPVMARLVRRARSSNASTGSSSSSFDT